MQKEQTSLGELKLIGIVQKTSNALEMNPETAIIGPTVQRYFSEGLASRIPGRKHPYTTYCAYGQYEPGFESNIMLGYTYFIGEEVDEEALKFVPEGFEVWTIPSRKYAKFTVGPGKMPQICIKAWQSIWHMSSEELGKRAYVTDFEIYDQRAMDPENTTLDIYIGLQ